jgi:hypothetical protein
VEKKQDALSVIVSARGEEKRANMRILLNGRLVARVVTGCAVLVMAIGALQASMLSRAQVTQSRADVVQSMRTRSGVDAATPIVTYERQLGSSPSISARAFLDQYCVTCHNARLKTANLMLDRLDDEHLGDNAETWEKVIAKLRSGSMPPAGRPRPDGPTLSGFVAALESSLDTLAAATPNPGRTVAHRLNRTEYANAIRDLLGLEIEGRALLPADGISGSGFDNDGDVLTMSPGLMERYISAARQISRLALGDPTVRPVTDTYKVSLFERQEDRASEDLPFGTRGGLAIHRNFSLNGEYVIKVRLLRTIGDEEMIRGFNRQNDVEVRLDGLLIARFRIGGEEPAGEFGGTVAVGNADVIYSKRTLSAHFQPVFVAPGVSIRHSDKVEDLNVVELHLPIKAGPRVVGTAFLDDPLQPEGVKPRFPTAHYSFQNDHDGLAMIESIEIAGPYDVSGADDTTPSRKRILACRPVANMGKNDEVCAKTILSTIARRAYRRPITGDDLEPLLSFYRAARDQQGFERGIEAGLIRILVSPQFLFRIEHDPANVAQDVAYRVSDLDLASRLSFFLWSSIPDDQLLDLAARGTLHDPEVLARQVRRMLADRRSKTLVSSFVEQWLALRNLQSTTRDLQEFPEFDDNLREAMQQETELFFDSEIRDDRPIPELLTANYTFLNERLARHYGVQGVYGRHMRRVELTDETRRGLLAQASILTVTSMPNRTSPTIRGKWVLEQILGAPPPAPPANVPSLEEQPATKFHSVRERLEAHRKNPVCAACHARIDPMGFALENFDAVGQWRPKDADVVIDASGVLDGTKFTGLPELRQLLEKRQDLFITNVTKKLLTYAVGRKVEYYDIPAVRQIIRRAAETNYRWSSIILEIVKSVPFEMRRSEQS